MTSTKKEEIMKSKLNRLIAVAGMLLATSLNCLNSSADVPHYRGKVVLIVDRTLLNDAAVPPKINTLIADMVGDGWQVLRHNVDAGPLPPPIISTDDSAWAVENAQKVREIKALIKADYD